jgi:hypothetical protein
LETIGSMPLEEHKHENDIRAEDWRKLSSMPDFSDFVICDDDVLISRFITEDM